ncbi:MAG TPA: hypothetical protein VIC28_13140, partial [Thermoanaerobaculia bacterium]
MTRTALRAVAWTLLALCPVVAEAGDVRIAIGPSGRKVILNESSSQRSLRLAPRLAALPDADLEPLIVSHS